MSVLSAPHFHDEEAIGAFVEARGWAEGPGGIYQHCSERHLHSYLAEFGLHYNHWIGLSLGDLERSAKAIIIVLKELLMYRDSRWLPSL